MLTNFFAFFLVLGLLIFIHEFGHFLVAKLLRIRVEVFSLGFGPRLFWFQRGNTEYRISALPLGGYVRMKGENPDDETSGDPDEFLSRPKAQRFLVLVMGATFNILLALILVAFTFQIGVWVPRYLGEPVIVGSVEDDSPGTEAGLQSGDRILRINDQEVHNWRDFQIQVVLNPNQSWMLQVERDGDVQDMEIQLSSSTPYRTGHAGLLPFLAPVLTGVQSGQPADLAGLRDGDRVVTIQGEPVGDAEDLVQRVMTQPGIPLTFVVSRQNETLEAVVTPEEREGRGFIGIWAYPRVQKKYGFFRSMRESLRVNLESSGLLFTTLGKLFGRKLSLRTLSGPVDIYRFSGATYRQGLVPFLSFMAMVSLQLGIINLLPIPILDGGHIFILGLEGIIRRDLSMRFKERVIQVGFVFLLVFMGVVIYLDVEKNNLLGWLWEIF